TQQIGGSVATRMESGRTGGHPPAPGPVHHVPDGPSAPLVALLGELRVVHTASRMTSRVVRKAGQLLLWGMAGLALAGSSGCTWDYFHLVTPPPPPPGPADSLVLHGDKLEPEKPPEKGTAAADLAGAEELYRNGEYKKAERVFHHIAEN